MNTSFAKILIGITFVLVLNFAVLNANAIIPNTSANINIIVFGLTFSMLIYGILCLNALRKLSLIKTTDYNSKYLNAHLEMAQYLDGNDEYTEPRTFENEIEEVEFNYWANNDKSSSKPEISIDH